MDLVVLSATGRVARLALSESYSQARIAQANQPRQPHDIISSVASVHEGVVGAVTSTGNAYRLDSATLSALDPAAPWSLAEAPAIDSLLPLSDGEAVVGVYCLDIDAAPLALGTRSGVVKRVVPEYKGWESWQVASLKEGDEVIGIGQAGDADEVVFITSDAQLLRTSAREVRAQGRTAGGMAGIKLANGADALFFTAIMKEDRDSCLVATLAVGDDSVSSVKISDFADYPAKGRATAGVRTHRFLKGQDRLRAAWVGLPPARACDEKGSPRNLPAANDRRDGGGVRVYGPFRAFG